MGSRLFAAYAAASLVPVVLLGVVLVRDSRREALERVMRSGGYADVLRRWGVPSGALETATINAGGGATAG